jgi:hypothetical protein
LGVGDVIRFVSAKYKGELIYTYFQQVVFIVFI